MSLQRLAANNLLGEVLSSSNQYWRANIRIVSTLMVIWFAASFGAGILFVDELDTISFFGFSLGFWFAQQGAIFVFILLIFIYVWLMKKLDKKFELND